MRIIAETIPTKPITKTSLRIAATFIEYLDCVLIVSSRFPFLPVALGEKLNDENTSGIDSAFAGDIILEGHF